MPETYEGKQKFSKLVLESMLEDIITEFFADDNQMGMWEVVEYVKGLYADEIDTLKDGPVWISGGNQ